MACRIITYEEALELYSLGVKEITCTGHRDNTYEMLVDHLKNKRYMYISDAINPGGSEWAWAVEVE